MSNTDTSAGGTKCPPGTRHRGRGRRRWRTIGIPIAVIALAFALFAAVAVRQLLAVDATLGAREFQSLRQYAQLIARELVYQIAQEEGRMLGMLSLGSANELLASLGEVDETFPSVVTFALRKDGTFLHPSPGDSAFGHMPLKLIAPRRRYLLNCVTPYEPTHVELRDGTNQVSVSLLPWRAEDTEGLIGLCWDALHASDWLDAAARATLPPDYDAEMLDREGARLARYSGGAVTSDAADRESESRVSVGEASLSPGAFTWRVCVYRHDPHTLGLLVKRQVRLFALMFGCFAGLLGIGVWMLVTTALRQAQLARMKTDFAANVSHELRTPLALIRAANEALATRTDLDDARRRRYLGIIDRESRRLGDLVGNVMNFALVERGARRYNRTVHEFVGVVRACLDDYADHIRDRGFTLDVRLCEAPLPVCMDADAIQAALVNLLDNALKFSGDGRLVRVSLERRDAMAVLSVTDEGIGIADEDRERIFEAFWRVETDLVKKTRGTGIGLSLVREIATAHGGDVNVTSQPGRGSTFELSVPLTKGEANDG